VDPELQGAFDNVRRQIAASALETRWYVEATEAGIRQHVDATAAETRRHFEVVAEGLRGDIRLVAEGLTRIDTLEVTLREEIGRSHDALAGLIRLAYVDLDRRVRVLEARPPRSD
jgi:hypothetical protein